MSVPSVEAEAVTVSTVTRAHPQLAFEVFTERMQQWWNPEHHVLRGQLASMNVEPYAGGRIWDESTEGEVCVWGRVLTWQPGEEFAFTWLIGPDWGPPGPDAQGSRVRVMFDAVDEGTRVTLVHDKLDVHGPGWDGLRAGVAGPGGWPSALSLYAAAADAAD